MSAVYAAGHRADYCLVEMEDSVMDIEARVVGFSKSMADSIEIGGE